jgi:hypothetical protein
LSPTDHCANQDIEDADEVCEVDCSAENVADFLFGLGSVNEAYHDAHHTEASDEQFSDDYLSRISLKAVQDLIELITAHLPNNHNAVTSLYKLRSYMKKKGGPAYDRKAAVCSLCHSLLPKDTETCPNASCQENGGQTHEFLVFDVKLL